MACCWRSVAPLRSASSSFFVRLLHLLLGFFEPLGRAIGRLLRLGRLLVAVLVAGDGEPGWPCDGGDSDGGELLGLPGLPSDGWPSLGFDLESLGCRYRTACRNRRACRIWSRPAFACRPVSVCRRLWLVVVLVVRCLCRRLSCRRLRLSCRPWLVAVGFLVAFGLRDVAAELAGVGGDALLILRPALRLVAAFGAGADTFLHADQPADFLQILLDPLALRVAAPCRGRL